MLLLISKFLVLPFYPVGAAITLSLAGLVLNFFKRTRKAAVVLFTSATFVLLVFSSPPVAHFLMRGLEKQYLPVAEHKPAPAVVLLGGASLAKTPPRIYSETNVNGDRLFQAARVFRSSGSDYLIATGGRIEFIEDADETEAESAYNLLTEVLGIDSQHLLLEKRSRNTRENALYVKEMMDKAGMKKEIILVTSAYHMPRSVGIFKKLGFTVYPSPTDYHENERLNKNLYALFPDADALLKSTIALHEYYGMLSYRVLGWM